MARNEVDWFEQEQSNYAGMEAWDDAQDEWIANHPPRMCQCDECQRAAMTLGMLGKAGKARLTDGGRWILISERQQAINKAASEVFKSAMQRGEW